LANAGVVEKNVAQKFRIFPGRVLLMLPVSKHQDMCKVIEPKLYLVSHFFRE